MLTTSDAIAGVVVDLTYYNYADGVDDHEVIDESPPVVHDPEIVVVVPRVVNQ